MSLNCRVFRDEKGQIDFVNAPNGNRSKLFDTLVSITGGNKNTALNIYALTEVEELKSSVNAKINAFKERFKNIVKVAPSTSTRMEEIMFSKTASSTPTYYSNAISAINNLADKNPKNIQGWLKQLTDVQKNGGVRNVNQELQWIGLEDYLNQYVKENNPKNGNISFDAVNDYIQSNQIEIVEVSKGKPEINTDDLEAEFDGSGFRIRYNGEGRLITPYITLDQIDLTEEDIYEEDFDYYSAQEAAKEVAREEMLDREDGEVKYQNYQLKGGENYREVLLTMPNKEGKNPLHLKRDELSKQYREAFDRGNYDLANEIDNQISEITKQLQVENSINATGEKSQYKSSHWDEANILAHVRLNEKTLPDGRRVLIVNEIQSDWAQDGRSKGFVENRLRISREQYEAEEKAIEQEALKILGTTVPNIFELERVGTQEAIDLARRVEENTRQFLYLEGVSEEDMQKDKVAQMPYKNTDQWVGLATRRVLQMAAQEGYDGVAFATGEQSADMYSLAKQIDRLSYAKNNDLTYDIAGYRNGESVFYAGKVSEDKLSATVGKEIAERIVNNVGETIEGDGTGYEKSLSGLDLEVGGEGMKTFYDKIVPKVAQKEAQRFDKNARISEVDFTEGEPVKVVNKSKDTDFPYYSWVDSYGNVVEGGFVTEEQALENKPKVSSYRDKTSLVKQPFIAITDKMRSELGKAIPLFSKTQGQEAPREVLDQVTNRLKQSGLANNVYQMSNSEIEAKLVELGVSSEIAKQVTMSTMDVTSVEFNPEEDFWEVYLVDGSYIEVYLSDNTTEEEVKEEAIVLLKEYLLDSMPTVYRGINGDFSSNYKGVQYFAVNKRYAGVFGRNIEEFRLKSLDILDLDNWNEKWGVKNIDFGQGLLTVHQDNLSNLEEWRDRIENSLLAVGVEVSKEEIDSFIKEVENAKIIKGEDVGNRGQIVFAVKDKSLVEPINKDIQFSKKGIKLNTAGFTYKGDVYLNSEVMGLDTPIHEFGHLHLDWLKENRNDLYKAGLSLIGKNKKEAQEYINIVKNTQPDLVEGTEKFNNEVLAQVIGDQGAKLINSKKKESIANWLQDVWEAIKDILGLSNYTADQVANMTLAEFGKASASEMLSGKVVDINNKVSEYLNRINTIKEKEPSNYWSVDVPSEEVVRNAVINDRLVEVPGGMGIVTEDGNMIGLFKDKLDAKNVARDLQMMRVEKGGIKMDNYDGYLTKIYQKNGFRVVSRLAFNEDYAPEDWNKEKHGTPDVVFMIYDPNNTLKIEEKSFTSDQYDEASDYRDSFIEDAKKIHPYYSNKLSENKTGKTQSFFSDVVRGDSDKYKAKKQWVPLLKYTKEQNDFNSLYSKFKGNFDNHIATSIPTFRETQVKVGTALAKMFGEKGGLIYDIGGSEGGFIKAITESTKGKVKSINLDVNEDMGKAHKKNPVKGSDFINEAFYEGYQDEDTGKMYPKHKPKAKADVVHESMVFQFITPERAQFIKEIKDNYLKEDGLVLLEEKLVPESDQEWLQNEYIKDQYKLQYYSQEEISGKAEEVLAGMRKNQTSVKDLQDALSSNFKYVEQYWDSGNFKGFVATNNIESLNKFRENFGSNVIFKGDTSEVLKSVKREPSLELNGTKIFAKERVNQVTGEKLDGIEWELIESTERGKGNARKAAELFLNGTDAQGQDVYLTISPRDAQTSAERLESFYSSLGFEKTSDFEMVRKARPITPKDLDSNGEVSVNSLMDFANSKVKPLSNEGLKAAKNTAMSLKVKTSKELIEKMEKALMKNGIVLFDKLSLQRSKLYNIFEINTILASPRLQKQIKESLLALRNSEPFVIEYDENFVVPQGREVNQFGKQEIMNPSIVEKELIDTVAGLEESEIDEALPSEFSNKYYTDADFRETVDTIAKNYKKAPVKTVIDGELVDKVEDVEGMLENTITGDSNESIADDIMFLRESIDEDIFNTKLKAVSKVLNKIKKNAYVNGIDLRNLPTLALELSRSEILGFLDSMEDAISNIDSEEDFKEFSERYYKILGDKEIKTETIKSESNNDVIVEDPLSEYEMFSKFGLVKKDDGIYRQVTEESLDTLYENFFEHKNLLPDSVETLEDLKRYVQKNASLLEISDYEVDVDNLEKIFLYKKFFDFPISTKSLEVSTDNFNKITNSEGYLTDVFVKDFNKWILATANPYFKVTGKGIELVNNDEISKEEAINSVPERFKQELAEYNVISKNLNLDLPLPEERYQDINTQLEQRQRAVNNPESVKKVSGQYTYLKDEVLAVKNESETFLRTPIGIFEKIFEFENIKFYGKLDTDSKKGYKKVSVEAPFSDINFKEYMYLSNKPESFKESKNYYSRKELDDINNEYFGCQ